MSLFDRFRRTPEPGRLVGDPDHQDDEARRAQEWTARLSSRIEQRAPYVRKLRDYYNGKHTIGIYSTKKWREVFGRDFGQITDNWCQLVVDAAVERMEVVGFRFPIAADDEPGDGDAQALADDADDKAWAIWQRNRLDLRSDIAHTEAITTGYSYLLVWPDDETGEPTITVEDPLQTIVEDDPARPGHRRAGLKRWRELDGTWMATLWTPDRVWTLTAGRADRPTRWRVEDEETNELGVVPIITLANNPDLYGHGRSDMEPMIPLNDAANKLFADMLIASEFAAYKQRVLLGAEIPTDPVTGEPDRRIVSGVNRWLAFEGQWDEENERFVMPQIQELSAADLGNYVKAIEPIITHIAALTKTPPQYLLAQMVNVSGDALKAAESGLVSRVERRIRHFSDAWEEAMRLAFAILGDEERAAAFAASSIWADPETTSEAARVDALLKMKQLGVPEEALWERWDTDPEERKRWLRMRDAQAISTGYTLGRTPSGTTPELAAAPARPELAPAS